MDAVIHWITQIIIFMLLATIVELLIPATSMKKYIKLVVALILILIFLKPVFYLFNVNVEDALNASYERLDNYSMEENNMESLIEFQKNDIQVQQSAYIEEQVAVQLIDLAKTPLLESYQMVITAIELSLASEEAEGYEDLEEVIVYVNYAKESEEDVDIVDEVTISTDTPESKTDSPDLEKIESLLRDVWEVEDKEKITVIWKGGTS